MFFCLFFFYFSSLPVSIMLLTILGDKSNATVDCNRDTIFSQLLVTERLAICASSQCDGRVPQCKVHLVEAMDVNCSNKERDKKKNVIFLSTQ